MELKPCPFCGGVNIKRQEFLGEAVVYCEDCLSRVIGKLQPERFIPAENGLYRRIEEKSALSDAMEKWNRRILNEQSNNL